MGRFVVITGPSGSGKTTVMRELIRRLPGSGRIVTTTTRGLREVEVDGVDYHFVSRRKFSTLVEKGEFLEHVEIYGHRYGSTIKALNDALARYEIVFAVFDPRGANALLKRFGDFTGVFLVPGSISDLERRLKEPGRNIPEGEREKRLRDAMAELALVDEFHHCVENREGELEATLETITDCIGVQLVPAP